MSRIITLGSRASRIGRSIAKGVSPRFLSLRQRLELLRQHKIRVARSAKSQRYRAQAEEYRFQAETFRDPRAQTQMHQLAAIYDRKATQAEECGD
jgi:putative hemolysin